MLQKVRNNIMGSKTNFGRKATFSVEVIKGQRVFTAVNRRAKIVCSKNGKRTKLTLSQLKSSVNKGSYKFFAYGADKKTLKPIKF